MSHVTSIYCSRTKEPNVICIPQIPPIPLLLLEALHSFRCLRRHFVDFYCLEMAWTSLRQPLATVDTLRECSNCPTTTYQKMIKISISHETFKFLNIPLPPLSPFPSWTCIHPHITIITLFGQNEQIHR